MSFATLPSAMIVIHVALPTSYVALLNFERLAFEYRWRSPTTSSTRLGYCQVTPQRHCTGGERELDNQLRCRLFPQKAPALFERRQG